MTKSTRKNHKPFKLTPLAFAAALVVNTPIAAYAAPAPTVREYHIPAGDLSHALNQLAQQSGSHISFAPTATQGLTTNGLNGRYTVAQGLATLLAGHSLAISQNGNNYSIQPAAKTTTKTTTKPAPAKQSASNTPHTQNTEIAENTVNTDTAAPEGRMNTVHVVADRMSRDEIGYGRQYTRDIVNLYKGKEAVERYKGQTVSDLLSGMVGVYSGDARNSGALDPNIRGMQGQGRIPVTVDGTEQAVTVWRGYAGVNNRNYVDPSLISSVYVEKGPSLNPEVRGGIGGSIALKTIDADDIVKPGHKYGAEIKLEGANNSISRRPNMYENNHQDYRTLNSPGDVTLGAWAPYFGGADRLPQRFNGRDKMFTDKAYRIAVGTKQDMFDAMVAYAYRKKGNYFSGKEGGKRYGEGKNIDDPTSSLVNSTDPYIPNLALIYKPGGEVTNTSLETKSWLGKFGLHLPDKQELKLGYRHTDTHFGEVFPSRLGPTFGHYRSVVEWPTSWVKQNSINLDYEWNPDHNRFIDFKASLWTTRTKSKTNTAGGSPGDVLFTDPNFDSDYKDWLLMGTLFPGMFPRPDPSDTSKYLPNTDGRFNVIDGAANWEKNNRNGFTVSNKARLTDQLELSVMGDYQHETLRSHNNFYDFFFNPKKYTDGAETQATTYNIALPRNGNRTEWNAAFNFKFAPTDWLTINAGARYTHFKLHDKNVENFYDLGVGRSGITGRKPTYQYAKGYIIQDNSKSTPSWLHLVSSSASTGFQYETGGGAVDYLGNHYELYDQYNNGDSNYAAHFGSNAVNSTPAKEFLWYRDKYGRFNLANSPLTPDKLPVDLNETYVDPTDGQVKRRYTVIESKNSSKYYKTLSPEQIKKLSEPSGGGWVPMASVTVNFTPNARAYVRYSEALRYPSLFEGTMGFSGAPRWGSEWKPEHAKNWEVGYVHDLTALLPSMRNADVRVNYFHNTTHDIIDRDDNYNFVQLDKQILTGVELAGRFDTGRWFGDLGVSRTLRNKVCDATAGFALENTVINNSNANKPISYGPKCLNGGMSGNSYLADMIQPRWSITANLGARFFSEKLELGSRFTYYSRVYDTFEKSLRNYENGLGMKQPPATAGGIVGGRWQPVAVYDAYAHYKLNKELTGELLVSNLTDRYYMDALTRSQMPAPGRTVKLSLTGTI